MLRVLTQPATLEGSGANRLNGATVSGDSRNSIRGILQGPLTMRNLQGRLCRFPENVPHAC